MNDKELIQKLNSLKNLNPEPGWKKSARAVLFNQISNSSAEAGKITIFDEISFELKNFFSFLSQPAVAVVGLFLVLAGAGFGAQAARTTKPGDSLYLARLWSEKAQLAVVFNKEEKAKLDMKFASVRAKEITEVMSSPEFDLADKKKVDKLAQNFKEEIRTVKDRLEEINKIREEKTVAAAVSIGTASPSVSIENDLPVGIGGITKDADGKVSSVAAGKNGDGIKIYEPSLATSLPASIEKTPVAAPVIPISSTTVSAETSTTTEDSSAKITKNLDDAEASFATNDFATAKNILEEVGQIIGDIDNGEVKGASESGTTTIENNPGTVGIGSSSAK